MNIHILAGVGMMTTPLAIELQLQGHTITVSDQEKIYPPFDKIIKKAKIKVNQTQINNKIDLYIIGSAYKNHPRTLDEFQQIKTKKLAYIPATQFLAQNLIKENSILIAGTYGKTTISSCLSWIYTKLNKKTSYFFGGQSVDNIPSLKITDSSWSIIEADESINGLDTQAKFLYYPVKYLILTSALWEHKDSYHSAKENFNAFKKLVSKVPPDGLIVYNPNNHEIQKLLSFSRAKTIPYNKFIFKTNLIGQHNRENINAVLTLCQALNLDMGKIIKFLPQFHGIKRRLEIISKSGGIIIDDFAQSVPRITSAIAAVGETYPDSPIKVYFEPNASFLQNINSIKGFGSAFGNCQEVIFSRLKYNHSNSLHRVTAKDFSKEIGPKFKYIPLNDQILDHFTHSLKPNDVLVHFSSGGLDGLKTLESIATKLNSKKL